VNAKIFSRVIKTGLELDLGDKKRGGMTKKTASKKEGFQTLRVQINDKLGCCLILWFLSLTWTIPPTVLVVTSFVTEQSFFSGIQTQDFQAV